MLHELPRVARRRNELFPVEAAALWASRGCWRLKEGFDHASPLKTLLTAFLGRLRAFYHGEASTGPGRCSTTTL